LLPHLTHSLRVMAEFVNADPSDVVLVQNATAGMNAVLQSMAGGKGGVLQPGDRVFMLDTGYGAVKKLAAEVCDKSGAVLDVGVLPLPLPVDDGHDAAVAAIVKAAVEQIKPNTKAVILDETTSNTAINMPVAELAAAVREVAGADCKVVVDGAHGLLAQPLDLPNSGADYYVSNCHKWFSSPKGVGVLWAKDPSTLSPLVVSHGFGDGAWSGFAWDGCRDYSAALSLPTVAKFWESLGVEESREYTTSLLHNAVAVLKMSWAPWGITPGTGGDLIAPMSMHGPMALVSLPDFLGRDATSADAKMVQDALHNDYTVECPVKCVEGKLYVRISAHVYNEPVDYIALGTGVVAIITNYIHSQQSGVDFVADFAKSLSGQQQPPPN